MVARPPRKIEYLPLDEIQAARENPKGHDDDGLDESFRRFGALDAAILDGRTGRLLGGHGRIEALRRSRDAGEDPPEGVRAGAKDWLVPVQTGWSSRDDEEADAAALALNQLTVSGGFEDDPLAAMLTRLDGSRGLIGTGFRSDDLAALLERTRVPDFAPADEGEQPPLDRRKEVECPECGHRFEPARA